MRLIDADSIPWDVEGVGEIPVITKDEIDQMPESVIRCKDCKYFMGDDYFCEMPGLQECFCMSGKRKEE